MNIQPLNEEFPWFEGPPRSEGLHLTPIIKDLLETLSIGPVYDETADPRLQFEKGYIWEELLSLAFGDRAAIRPEEIVCDGIACSPDGVDFTEESTIVEEYKCTKKSSARMPDENPMWMMQVKGYCHVMESTTCIFRILHLDGNYSDVRVPQYMCYQLDFTESELQENWTSIVNHAKMRGWL